MGIISTNKQGYGEFRWKSGNIYKGNYKNDLRNGYGEMSWTDGSVYKGNWVNGIQHGFGCMRFLDGTSNEGIFNRNIFQGPAKKRNSEIEEESYGETQEGKSLNEYKDGLFIEKEDDEGTEIPMKSKTDFPQIKRILQHENIENSDEEVEERKNKRLNIERVDEERNYFNDERNK